MRGEASSSLRGVRAAGVQCSATLPLALSPGSAGAPGRVLLSSVAAGSIFDCNHGNMSGVGTREH